MYTQALYLKYRPRTFADVEGQEHITQSLRNQVALGRVAHAYLLTGPRGTGKTTTARLLAKAINCLADQGDKPCNACAVCQAINEDRLLDLIEIDAATHTGAEHMRELREKADFAPSDARFKVYIIDEVHMLSTAAFNALLKILEEPPTHVVFILATTDPQKIPATVLSRVQRFDFRRLTLKEIESRLNRIAAEEKLHVEPAAIELIARQATGAMRDAISLLDQMRAYGDEISLAQVHGLLGAGSQRAVSDLVARLAVNDVAGGLGVVGRAVDDGADPRQLAREIVEYLRGLLLLQSGSGNALSLSAEALEEMKGVAAQFTPGQLLRVIRLFNQAAFELKASANPTLPLEVALVEASLPEPSHIAIAASQVEQAVKPKPARQTGAGPKGAATPVPKKEIPPPEMDAPITDSAVTEPLTVEALRAHWNDLLTRVHRQDRVVEALLKAAEPIKVEGNQVILGFSYETHAERFEKQANGKATIEKGLEEIFHIKSRVKCILSPHKARLKAVEDDPLIRAAVSQMGAKITEIHDQEISK